MRYRKYTLTPAQVHTHACWRIQKHLRLADHGRKCTADTLWTVLFYAASRIISLAAACAALRQAPSDTATHDALLATLPSYLQLQRRLNRALQGDLPHALRRRRQPLTIDLVYLRRTRFDLKISWPYALGFAYNSFCHGQRTGCSCRQLCCTAPRDHSKVSYF